VVISQPYVPEYREPLWSRVIQSLSDNGVDCHLFYGGDKRQLAIRARRGDAVTPSWASQVKTWTFQPIPGSPKLLFRVLPSAWRGRKVLLVTEMQALNLNAWLACILGKRYITLGHGSSNTTHRTGPAARLENYLNRHAAHVLTYTEVGRQHVIESAAISPQRVTAFRNSTDTNRLQQAMRAVSPYSLDAFRREHGIDVGARVAFYLGALNEHKQIDLLVEAANTVLREGTEWWLIVAGYGPEVSKLEALAKRSGRVILLGQVAAEQYADAAALSTVLLNPGRVGLVAVDALVMRLPVLTTSAGAHAPELEYLRPGVDVFEVSADADEYAAAWEGYATAVVPPAAPAIPTVEAAADLITEAILGELGIQP
jgi:glycosyltransferase involved in cell wall biosynthesis